MNLEKYTMDADEELFTFEFESHGPKGRIRKIVQYTKTNWKDIYNLGFGDKDENTGEISDFSISNNLDSNRVLATVASSVSAFTLKYPHLWVYATGSSESRTRLYQMGISRHLDEIQLEFEVFGLRKNQWIPFSRNINYQAFIIKRKNINFDL
ncbi:MAG: hypothetical protein RLY35_421 [Bacteroidota bacterium]|jgi:hypothetical protein